MKKEAGQEKGKEGYKIFVVEDDEWYSKFLEHTLNLDPENLVTVFRNGKDCLKNLEKGIDIITLDHFLPDMDGLEVLKKIKEMDENIEVILVSGQENVATAVELLRKGAFDYLVKNEEIRDRLLNTIKNIKKNSDLRLRVSRLQKEVEKKYDLQGAIIGKSTPMEKLFSLIGKAVGNNINVMISGETGTGKELVAKSIHFNSKRSNGPFIPVNMAAIPSELVESELFGHEKGAFTGAEARRKGKFEEASGGTIFLDEIGEMDLQLQVKLLRVIQEREVTRVGGNEQIPINCRIIVATNRDLQKEVKENRFREDLYYRLWGLPIHLPPLRERGEDILILTKKFIEGFCKENEQEIPQLSQEAQEKLLNYHYPGNVRELRSIVELAVVLSEDGEIRPEHIRFTSEEDALSGLFTKKEMTLREYEREIVKNLLSRYDQDVKKAAEKLDIGVSTIYRMLKEGS